MVAYLYRRPAGIPGDVNRAFVSDVFTEVITPFGTTGHPTAYGIPVVIDATSGQVRMLASGDAAAAVRGLLVRPYPTHSTTDPLGTSTPPTDGPCNVMTKGCMSVLLSGSSAAVKGGQVYVWTAAASGSHIVGGFESTDPSTSGFALTGAKFRGPADANGITEVEFNL